MIGAILGPFVGEAASVGVRAAIRHLREPANTELYGAGLIMQADQRKG